MQIVIDNSYCKIVGDIPRDLNATLANTLSYSEKSDGYRRHKVKERFGYYPPAKVIYVYDFKTQKFPTGLLHDVVTLYKKMGYEYELKDLRKRPDPYLGLPWNNPHELRDYQEDAVDAAVKSGRGRIEASTGGGKGLIYMRLVYEIGVRTLIVCSKRPALHDMYTEAKTCFPEELLGRIGDGYKKHGTAITMITNASFVMLSKEALSMYEAVIVDEAHHIGGQLMETLYMMDCYYKFGGSGTQFRTDGSSILLQAATGRILARIKAKQLQEEGTLSKSHITFVEPLTPYISSKLFSDFIEIYDATVVNNDARNKLILKILKKHLGQQVLILSIRIEHGKSIFEDVIKLDPTAIRVDGTMPKAEMTEKKNLFFSGKAHTCVSSSVFDESINLPNLQVMIVASAGKSGISVIQRLGRILRKTETKNEAWMYDMYDTHNDKLHKQSLARISELKKEGHTVRIIKENEL